MEVAVRLQWRFAYRLRYQLPLWIVAMKDSLSSSLLSYCFHLHVSVYYNIEYYTIYHGVSVGDFHKGTFPVRSRILPVLLITLLITPDF